jgi:hypothetical protein
MILRSKGSRQIASNQEEVHVGDQVPQDGPRGEGQKHLGRGHRKGRKAWDIRGKQIENGIEPGRSRRYGTANDIEIKRQQTSRIKSGGSTRRRSGPRGSTARRRPKTPWREHGKEIAERAQKGALD